MHDPIETQTIYQLAQATLNRIENNYSMRWFVNGDRAAALDRLKKFLTLDSILHTKDDIRNVQIVYEFSNEFLLQQKSPGWNGAIDSFFIQELHHFLEKSKMIMEIEDLKRKNSKIIETLERENRILKTDIKFGITAAKQHNQFYSDFKGIHVDIIVYFLSTLGKRELGMISLASTFFYNITKNTPALNRTYSLWCQMGPKINLFIKELLGETTPLTALSNRNTIFSIKEQLQNTKGIPPGNITFIYNGKKLPDDKTLEECGIENCATLHSANLRGD